MNEAAFLQSKYMTELSTSTEITCFKCDTNLSTFHDAI